MKNINAVLGWTILLSIAFLCLVGFLEGFTGEPQVSDAVSSCVGALTCLAGIWGAIQLIRK